MTAAAELLAGFRHYLENRSDASLAEFTVGLDWAMTERPLAPRALPVIDYVQSAVPSVASGEASLLGLLSDIARRLHWGQTYDSGDFGDEFLARYGWVELFGTRGHFASNAMAGGLLLLGPGIHYPDHHHIAEEIYIPLTPGSLWSKDAGGFAARAAGDIIYHPSNIRHAMQTSERPLIALYLWRGGPLAQKSAISGRET